MTKGIYQYKDLKTGNVVYIGKDSNIHKNSRHKHHLCSTYYNTQQINRVIQNNPERYEYSVLYCSDNVSDDDLNMLEMSFIEIYEPLFNFTKGGEGITGHIHTNETKQKLRKINLRKDLNDDILVKEYFENELSKNEIAEKYKCSPNTVSNRLKSLGHQLRDNCESQNTTGYFRVHKTKCKTCKQGFMWKYQYYANGKRKVISSTEINELKKKSNF